MDGTHGVPTGTRGVPWGEIGYYTNNEQIKRLFLCYQSRIRAQAASEHKPKINNGTSGTGNGILVIIAILIKILLLGEGGNNGSSGKRRNKKC